MTHTTGSFECLKQGDKLLLMLHIVPRAQRNAVLGLHGDRLKVSISAAPSDNAANETLVVFLAQEIGLPKSAVELIRGQTSRQKTVQFSKECESRVCAWLNTVLAAGK